MGFHTDPPSPTAFQRERPGPSWRVFGGIVWRKQAKNKTFLFFTRNVALKKHTHLISSLPSTWRKKWCLLAQKAANAIDYIYLTLFNSLAVFFVKCERKPLDKCMEALIKIMMFGLVPLSQLTSLPTPWPALTILG